MGMSKNAIGTAFHVAPPKWMAEYVGALYDNIMGWAIVMDIMKVKQGVKKELLWMSDDGYQGRTLNFDVALVTILNNKGKIEKFHITSGEFNKMTKLRSR